MGLDIGVRFGGGGQCCGGSDLPGPFQSAPNPLTLAADKKIAVANTIGTIPGITAGPLTAWLVRGAEGAGGAGGRTSVFALAAAVNVVGAVTYQGLSKAHRIL